MNGKRKRVDATGTPALTVGSSLFHPWGGRSAACSACGIDLGWQSAESSSTCLACRIGDKGQVKIIRAYLRVQHEEPDPLGPRRPPVIDHNRLYENAEDVRGTAPDSRTSFTAAPVFVAVVGNQVFRLAEMKPTYGNEFEFVPSSLRK
jgi:hypothetical protein